MDSFAGGSAKEYKEDGDRVLLSSVVSASFATSSAASSSNVPFSTLVFLESFDGFAKVDEEDEEGEDWASSSCLGVLGSGFNSSIVAINGHSDWV